MHWIALSGSLREQSLNTALLHVASRQLPAGVTMDIIDLSPTPLYNSDLDQPPAVVSLIQAITQANGVLLATPEYNYSFSGVLKNALDWASRPAYNSCFAGKPTAMLSASMSPLGGVRAQQHLRSVLAGMGSPVLPGPDYCLATAHQQFVDGNLTDATALSRLNRLLAEFKAFVGRF